MSLLLRARRRGPGISALIANIGGSVELARPGRVGAVVRRRRFANRGNLRNNHCKREDSLHRRQFALSLAAACAAAPARAQAWPSGPVRLIVPLGAGGAMDVLARLLASELQGRLGQPFVVENITGGGTLIAAQTVARAKPDGQTLLVAPSGMLTTNLVLFKQLPYDARKDFIPVAHYVEIAFVLVVNPTLGINSLDELVKAAKAKPGALTYGSTGIGQVPHLAGEMLARQTGTQLTHVPYRGMPQALMDVVSGQVSMTFGDPSISRELINDGKVRAIGVSSKAPIPTLPDVKPLADIGLPGYEAVSWHMLLAPTGTPRAIAERLRDEVTRAMNAPSVRDKLPGMGLAPYVSETIDELPAFQQREADKWGAIVRAVGLEGTQ